MTRLTGLPSETLLRLALKLDAAVTVVNGVAYLVAAEPLEDALGVATSLLRPAGAFLVAFAGAVWLVAARASASRAAVAAVIAANAAWALGSIVLLVLDTLTPTTLGAVWVALQALVVAGFAALQRSARPL